eukprot:COSAG01_NODE_43526_length_429_cov_0.269697_1_plen_53_part_00
MVDALDTTGDGRIDTRHTDTTGDGQLDAVGFDTTRGIHMDSVKLICIQVNIC